LSDLHDQVLIGRYVGRLKQFQMIPEAGPYLGNGADDLPEALLLFEQTLS
jgi:hypothetical protein